MDAPRPLDHGLIYFLTTLAVSSIARAPKPHEFRRLEGWHDPPCTSRAFFTRGRGVGGVCPAQVRVFSFVVFPRLASSSSVRRTCVVRESGPGVAPRRAWGCEGSARAVPPFFVSASALGRS